MNMLRHVLAVMGMTSSVVRHEDYTPDAIDGYDLVIVGPGPGRPARRRPPEDRGVPAGGRPAARAPAAVPGGLPRPPGAVQPARASTWPTRTSSSRAPSRASTSTGREENVGFYNTFVARAGGGAARGRHRRRPIPRPATCTWSRGPHFRGIQFHAESILTEHGYDLIHDLVLDLLA